ncbi:hypothetical protein HG537_0C01980 [Torulaspora globosa]|uniref:Major facilitator superfamily (MFS) profile domain-containing protein n=1 Tax=Torulaspora globosa TaxID=48254 RepID=A0A7H9HQJ1_9SACH|nr:hypothetical protein HG537_0C01980 [Torulaspora sp. CBS 2947]
MARQRLTSQVLYATFVACLGSVQYGYHTAELNAPQQVMSCSEFRIPQEDLPYDKTWLGKHNLVQCVPLDDEQFGVVTAMFSLGGIAGSYYAGGLADRFGRRTVAFYTSLIGVLGSLLLFASNSYRALITGRIIVGVASGTSIVVTPLLINEIAPADWRGALGSLNQLFINLGILLTQSLALRFADSYRWRWLLFTGAVVAAANFVLLFRISESPKWLTLQGRTADAEWALRRLRGGASYSEAHQEVEEWQRELPDPESHQQHQQRGPTLWQYVRDPVYRKPRNVIIATLTGQQFCGINSIVFYGVKVIGQLLPEHAIQVNFAVSILNVLMTLVASFVIDRFGPKRLLQWSTGVMSAMSLCISIGITTRRAALLVVATLVYIGAFALGLGPVPFLLIGQISAPQDAATAQSFGTICNWLATAFVAYGFPIANGMLGGYVYLVFAAVALAFAVYAHSRIPDTRKRTGYEQLWAEY